VDTMGLELFEQLEVWRRLWGRRGEVADLIAQVSPTPPGRVVFTGCGDCHAAAEYGESLLAWRSELPAQGLAAMELSRARSYLLGPGSLLVAASVSGRTPRVLEAVQAGLRNGASVLAITDDPAGPLARAVSSTLILGTAPPETLGVTDYQDSEAARYAGYQRPVPQTKTFGALQLAVALTCLELARLLPSGRGTPRATLERELERLRTSASAAAEVAHAAANALLHASRPLARVTFCATGLNAGTARFCAYKLLELTVPAAFADIEEFCHTQYLVTGPGDVVVFLVQDEAGFERAGEIAPVLEREIGAACATLTTGPGRGEGTGRYTLGGVSTRGPIWSAAWRWRGAWTRTGFEPGSKRNATYGARRA